MLSAEEGWARPCPTPVSGQPSPAQLQNSPWCHSPGFSFTLSPKEAKGRWSGAGRCLCPPTVMWAAESWSSFPQTSILECGRGLSIGSQDGVKRVQ